MEKNAKKRTAAYVGCSGYTGQFSSLAFLRRCFFHYIRFTDKPVMKRIVEAHYPGMKRDLLREAMTLCYEIREVPGLKKKHATLELLDRLKLLVADEVPVEALARRIPT